MTIVPTTVTVADAMEALHVSRNQIYKLIRSGRLRAYRVSPRHVLIDAQSLASMFVPIG